MAKKEKGNCTQSQAQRQNVYSVPFDVFRSEKECYEKRFPRENCRYKKLGARTALIGYVNTKTKSSEDVVKYLKNCINAKINEWNRGIRCAVPGEQGGLIRCPDCNKCSNCPFGVKPEDRLPTTINWDEPENITAHEELDNPVMNEAESELEFDAIIEAMKCKNADIAEVFVRRYLHGYELSEIASDLGIQERRARYLLEQGEEIRDRLMNY